MSKFKVKFTIKQHTPIIHFQSDQSGATLRASELKPKFDKFLKKYAFKNEDYKKYLIKDTEAFDYKVKINFVNVEVKDIVNKTYFGNMGKNQNDHEYRKQTKAKELINIEFLSLNKKSEEIIQNIKNYFSSFLVIENFGARQNKGFGSFYLDKSDKNYIKPLKALDKVSADYIYTIYQGNKKAEQIFPYVEVIYPLIKTGINYPDYAKIDHPKGFTDKNGKIKKVPDPDQGRGKKESYYKSYLFQYMLDKNIGNEKRFIKENFFRRDIQLQSDGMKKKYVRALLGVGGGIDFKDHERYGKIEYTHKEIERFKSPLTFKIIDNMIFIITKEINQKIFNTTFTFINKVRDREYKKTIQTPHNFDLVDFLYSFADYFNNLELKTQNKNMFDEKIEQAKKSKFQKAQR